MEPYILISYLNDFVFCPKSIYFHNLYGSINTTTYHTKFQIEGNFSHQSIDNNTYSNKKDILQGIDVFCEKYKIFGKIDVFDSDKGILIERKKHIEKIYDGYVFQVYAQYYALMEMGFDIKEIYIYSLDTNKKFLILLPDEDTNMKIKFERTIEEIKNFNIEKFEQENINKCKMCIYYLLCNQDVK